MLLIRLHSQHRFFSQHAYFQKVELKTVQRSSRAALGLKLDFDFMLRVLWNATADSITSKWWSLTVSAGGVRSLRVGGGCQVLIDIFGNLGVHDRQLTVGN